MTSNLDLSKINTTFDIIKLKNDFLGETNKVYLKSVFETNCFKIKELYRLYGAYDKELNKELNYKIDQKILDKTLYVKHVYDLTSIVLEDYSLNTHEWNFLFEELNTNLNLNKIKESKEKCGILFRRMSISKRCGSQKNWLKKYSTVRIWKIKINY